MPLGRWFKLSANPIAPGTVFTWDFGDGSPKVIWDYTRNTDSIYHVFDKPHCGKIDTNTNKPLNGYTVSVTAENGACTPIIATVGPIIVYDTPAIDFKITSFCAGVELTLFNLSIDDSCCKKVKRPSYSWVIKDSSKTVLLNTGGQIKHSDSTTFTFKSKGQYEITIRKVAECCIDTLIRYITIDTFPLAQFSLQPDTSVYCAPSTIKFLNQTDAYSFTSKWSISGSKAYKFVNNTDTGSASPEVQFTDTGIYYIQLITSNSCGTDTTLDTVYIAAPPVVRLPADLKYCDTLTINFATDPAHKPWFDGKHDSILTYEWAISGASSAYLSGTHKNSKYPHVRLHDTGVYRFIVKAENKCGWSLPDTQYVHVWRPPLAHAGKDTFICYHSTIHLGEVPVATRGSGTYTYKWQIQGDTTVISKAPNPGFQLAATTTFILEVTDSRGCKALDTVIITVNPELKAKAPDDFKICEHDSVLIGDIGTASGGTSPYSYSWKTASGKILRTSSFYYKETDTHTVVLTVTDSKGCSAIDSSFIGIHRLPAVQMVGDTFVCISDTLKLSSKYDSSHYLYKWVAASASNAYATNAKQVHLKWNSPGIYSI